MSYFKQFPNIIINKNLVVDIFRYVSMKEGIGNDIYSYLEHNIQNGERPDVVSQQLYGTPSHAWTFFAVNDKLSEGLNGWPRSSGEIQTIISETFENLTAFVFPFSYRINGLDELEYFTIGGIPFDEKYLEYLELVYEPITGTKYTVPIHKYIPSLNQLLVKSDNVKLNGADSTIDKLLWNKSATSSRSYRVQMNDDAPTNLTEEWEDLVIADQSDKNRIVTSPGSAFYTFLARDYWKDARNAPASYQDPNDLDVDISIIDAYDKLNPQRVTAYTSWEDTYIQENDELSTIRVIRPEFIDVFARAYIAKINE